MDELLVITLLVIMLLLIKIPTRLVCQCQHRQAGFDKKRTYRSRKTPSRDSRPDNGGMAKAGIGDVATQQPSA